MDGEVSTATTLYCCSFLLPSVTEKGVSLAVLETAVCSLKCARQPTKQQKVCKLVKHVADWSTASSPFLFHL